MGKRKYANLHHETEVDLIPMMDLALNLTFFFVVLATLVKDEVAPGINLPVTDPVALIEEAAVPDSISINVDANAQVQWWGKVLDLRSESDLDQLTALVRNEAQRNKGDSKDVKTTVLLYIDQNVDYADFQKVIDICQAEGFYKFVMKSRMEGG
jgi:biopolymer transport protein ExbD